MHRFVALAALVLAPVAVRAQTTPAPAPTPEVSSDTLAARVGRVETLFFGGNTADLRALSDSAFAEAMTDAVHQNMMMQLMSLGGATASGDWTAFEIEGMRAYKRSYAVGGMTAQFLVVFDGQGRVAGIGLRPEGR